MGKHEWWKGGVIYQIYPRSFADANDDGTGDLVGITRHLDYVARLGVDAVWISPFFRSPMKDHGYDVSDYRDVDPLFGNVDDFCELLEAAHRLGLKVIIDQVLSHTSDQHAWFQESRKSRANAKADWYVWADPRPDGTPPNNWQSMFGGAAWSWDSRRRQYYLHNFLSSQPDLNFHNPEVRAAQLDNVRYWLEMGVDGFRLDVVNFYFHDARLRSNPPISEDTVKAMPSLLENPYGYQRHVHDITQPDNIPFLRRLRQLVDAYPSTTLMGEISDDDPLRLMCAYTSGDDKLHMAYTFDLLREPHSADYIRNVVRRVETSIADGWACWALSNHDVVRCATRWGRDEDPEAYPRIVLAMLLSLRGTVCLYQGEELGLPEADVPRERIQDPFGLPFWPVYKGRDGCRTPMAWDTTPRAGFSRVEPWLPVDPRHRARAVAAQERSTTSCLHAARTLLAWRRQQPALIEGDLSLVPESGEMLSWIRTCPDQSLFAAFNLTRGTLRARCPVQLGPVHAVAGLGGRIEGDQVVLGPYEGLFADVAGRVPA